MRTKGEQSKAYQTPYGEVIVNRHVYQRSGGGKTYCPLERDVRIIITRAPFFAKQVSSKLAYGSAREVQRDLSENHARPVAVSYIQCVSEAVASIIEAKEEEWEYVPPKLDVEISSVAIGLDGTCMLLCETGWREVMVGTISLYDEQGERQHTIYIGATPEYGNARFLERLEREIERTKARYPKDSCDSGIGSLGKSSVLGLFHIVRGHLKTRPLSLRSEVVPAWLLLAFYSDLLLTIFNINPLSILKEQKYSLKCIGFVVNRYLRRSALIVDSPEILILLSFRIKDVISIWVRQ